MDNIPMNPVLMSYFDKALDIIKTIHSKKKKDYTAAHREFGNFEDSAKHAGITVAQAIENLIGTKEARRRNLEHSNFKPINESIEDTLLDRAVYCLIRYAHYLKEKDEELALMNKQACAPPLPIQCLDCGAVGEPHYPNCKANRR